jgi:hypothetical protein
LGAVKVSTWVLSVFTAFKFREIGSEPDSAARLKL